MRNAFLLMAVCLAFAAWGQGPCPLISDVTVDGNAEEWGMTWIQDDDKIFRFNVCADEQNLYVRVTTSEFYTKRKMAAFGFTLWFDAEGKKKRSLGLRFPSGGAEAQEKIDLIQAEGEPGASASARADYQKRADRTMINGLEVMELIGLTDDPITSTRSGITNGIKVAIGMDESTESYVYEAIIPFKAFRISRANLEEMYVGFETGKYVAPKQKATTKNAPLAGGDLTPGQLSRLQGYKSQGGNPKFMYSTNAWTKLVLKKN